MCGVGIAADLYYLVGVNREIVWLNFMIEVFFYIHKMFLLFFIIYPSLCYR
jgi:hypothetical protein